MTKKIIIAILWMIAGTVCLTAGFAALYPIEPFELILMSTGIVNWTFLPFLSRMLISSLLLLGSFLFVPRLINFLLLIVQKEYRPFNKNKLLLFLLISSSIAIPLILDPIRLNIDSAEAIKPDVDISLLPTPVIDGYPRDLKEGKIILSFFLVHCPHCKFIAQMLNIARGRNKLPEIVFIFSGNEEAIPSFMEETNVSFPYVAYNKKQVFKMTNGIFPSIVYLQNGRLEKYWTGETFTYGEIEKLSHL